MSSSETGQGVPDLAVCLARASAGLAAAFNDPDRVPEDALQDLLRHAVRLYAAKTETGLRSPFPPRDSGVSADDVMIIATDMLHALNVQLFELSMWQAMTGNCMAPNHRLDSTV